MGKRLTEEEYQAQDRALRLELNAVLKQWAPLEDQRVALLLKIRTLYRDNPDFHPQEGDYDIDQSRPFDD